MAWQLLETHCAWIFPLLVEDWFPCADLDRLGYGFLSAGGWGFLWGLLLDLLLLVFLYYLFGLLIDDLLFWTEPLFIFICLCFLILTLSLFFLLIVFLLLLFITPVLFTLLSLLLLLLPPFLPHHSLLFHLPPPDLKPYLILPTEVVSETSEDFHNVVALVYCDFFAEHPRV